MLRFTPGNIRLDNDKIYIRTPGGEISYDIAPLNKAMPYYRNFRQNLNLNVVGKWPTDIVRRFIYDFKPQMDKYVARPSRTTQNQLINKLDMIIGKAIEPPKN